MEFPKYEISYACSNCGHKFKIIYNNILTSIKCEKCGNNILSTRTIRGAIYAASNESMPGLFKIGMTTRAIEDRLSELSNTTGVPSPFVLECLIYSDEPEIDETKIHEKLWSNKIANKEFFRLKRGKLLRVVEEICGRQPHYVRSAPKLDIVKKDGRYLCPHCGKIMGRLQNKSGWSCKKCDIRIDNYGREIESSL